MSEPVSRALDQALKETNRVELLGVDRHRPARGDILRLLGLEKKLTALLEEMTAEYDRDARPTGLSKLFASLFERMRQLRTS